MKFIDKLISVYKKDGCVLHALSSMVGRSDVHMARFENLVGFPEDSLFYLIYSEGEVAVVMLDTYGVEDELLDEEIFNDEKPLWFSESTHRTSPFYLVRLLTEAVKRSLPEEIVDDLRFLSVLVTNTTPINFDDFADVFPANGGVVFFDITNTDDFKNLACRADLGLGTDITDRFVKAYGDRPQELLRNIDGYPVMMKREDDDDEGVCIPMPSNLQGRDALAVEVLPPVVSPKDELDNLVGLSDLKKHLAEVTAYARFHSRIRQQFPSGCHLPGLNLHSIVVGSPGVGKTTFCQLYASLLREAGLLNTGHTVVSSRATFVGEHFGHEERRMGEALKLAEHGVLFIDEAGDLINHPHPSDPGRVVLNNLLQITADESHRHLAVVLALYDQKSLDALYRINPGFRSRFPNVFHLPDYNVAELLQILRLKARKMGITITPGAWQKMCKRLSDSSRSIDFANGRSVTNLLQECLVQHAIRCEKRHICGSSLLRITASDVPAAHAVAATQRIGFS